MIDIHTHILYGIDDGARSLEELLQMAAQAAQQDISRIIATPHHADGRHWNPGIKIRQLVESANAELRAAQIPTLIYPGQEVRLYRDLLQDLQDSKVLTLNDSRYLLLELPSSRIPNETFDVLHELSLLGIIPIIAHPERHSEIAADLDKMDKLIQAGALGQVTSHSLSGKFGRKVRQIALEMCKRNLVHFIATDAHRYDTRNMDLRSAFDIVLESLGQDYHDYYLANARAVWDDEPIDVWPVMEQKRRRFLFFK